MKTINLFKFFISIFILVIIQFTNSYSQLSGNYTIGTGGNYSTITLAVNALTTQGVSSPVTFNLKSGNYNEKVVIDSIPGASVANYVIIKSQTGVAENVNWYSSDLSSEFTLKINSGDFITIQNISFTNMNNSVADRSRIYITGYIENLKIMNNNFYGIINKDNGLISRNAVNKNLVISNNVFNTKFGINFKEIYARSLNTKIIDNTFNCNRGVEINYHDNLLIEKNNIRCSSIQNSESPSPSGIRVAGCNGDLKVQKNKLNCLGIEGSVDGIVVGYYSGTNALVANNFISLKTGTGIWVDASTNIHIYFNTVKTSSHSSGDITFVGCSSVYSRNNIMVNLGNFGSASLTYYLINSTFTTSDFNIFFYNNPYILYGTNIGYVQNLSQFRALTGLDMHSLEIPVYFLSDTNLHLSGTSLSDPRLRGTPVSMVSDDIDGNQRNSLYPTMGADEDELTGILNSATNNTYSFSLSQNYPNPFNPSTQIIYEIPVKGFISLNVFDISGKNILSLVNENQEAGTYSVTFKAENLSSGTYFYKLTFGDFTETKKMFLIK